MSIRLQAIELPRAAEPAAPEWRMTSSLTGYPEAMATMEARVDEIIEGRASELIWLLQHPPLYTGGTSADVSEIKDAARFLNSRPICCLCAIRASQG